MDHCNEEMLLHKKHKLFFHSSLQRHSAPGRSQSIPSPEGIYRPPSSSLCTRPQRFSSQWVGKLDWVSFSFFGIRPRSQGIMIRRLLANALGCSKMFTGFSTPGKVGSSCINAFGSFLVWAQFEIRHKPPKSFHPSVLLPIHRTAPYR
ncbi:hypothetical protein GOODEAATRI_028125 [Goodea atripinnis]|uniref:Cytochrome c biogenesis B n=1 Tax=Goodea atripinnis TaxID=208336 RepID=A0ABV0MLD3_9TELE